MYWPLLLFNYFGLEQWVCSGGRRFKFVLNLETIFGDIRNWYLLIFNITVLPWLALYTNIGAEINYCISSKESVMAGLILHPLKKYSKPPSLRGYFIKISGEKTRSKGEKSCHISVYLKDVFLWILPHNTYCGFLTVNVDVGTYYLYTL